MGPVNLLPRFKKPATASSRDPDELSLNFSRKTYLRSVSLLYIIIIIIINFFLYKTFYRLCLLPQT